MVVRKKVGPPESKSTHRINMPNDPAEAPGSSTSASLRTRKKQQQRADLLEIGTRLFRQNGYEQTRMEDIAALASVSTKTVYNYFPTKERILIAFLDQDRIRLQAAYEKVVNHPPSDPAEALALLIRADVGYVRTIADKRLWRELLGAATRGHDRAEDEFDSNRRMFTMYIEQLLRHYIAAGCLSSKMPLAAAVDVVYAVNAYNFREFCADRHMTPNDLLVRVRDQMKVIVLGWSTVTQRARVQRNNAKRRSIASSRQPADEAKLKKAPRPEVA